MVENLRHWYMQMQPVGFALISYDEKQPRQGLVYLGFATQREVNDRAWAKYEKLRPPSEEVWIGGTE